MLEAEASAFSVLLMMLQGRRSDYHVLSLLDELILHVEGIAEPDLIGVIDHSEFTGVIIKFEYLDDLNLEVEIVVPPGFPLLTSLCHFGKLSNVSL